MSDEKTEEPTDKKLEDARKKGQSTKSPDVNAAAGLLTATICLSVAAHSASEHLLKLFSLASETGLQVQSNIEMLGLALEMAKEGMAMVLPFVVASVLMGLVASFAQVGLIISFEPLQPDFDKVNPASGLKKLFSVRSIVDFMFCPKMVFKALMLGSVVVVIGLGLMPLLVGASLQTPVGVVHVAWAALLKLFGAAVIVFVVIGPVDFGVQKWLFIRDQRMSKDEVKREHKDMEGDPLIKQQRRQLAQEMVSGDPKARVPTSTAVVTNPTHYAVALRYVPGETALPVVVAKGAGAEAARIRAIAEAHGVPVVGNPPLARALFLVPLDEPVPEPLFEAVAAVLRWVRMIDRLTRQAVQDPADDKAPGGAAR